MKSPKALMHEAIGKRNKAKIEKAFDKLPGNPDDIAELFREKGYLGCSGAYNCPTANYLAGQGVSNACVGSSETQWAFSTNVNVCVKHPVALRHFIRKFDNGHYPFLNLESEGVAA